MVPSRRRSCFRPDYLRLSARRWWGDRAAFCNWAGRRNRAHRSRGVPTGPGGPV